MHLELVLRQAAIRIGLACQSKKNHRCLCRHHWKSLGDCFWTSSDVSGNLLEVFGSLTSIDIGGFSCLGMPGLCFSGHGLGAHDPLQHEFKHPLTSNNSVCSRQSAVGRQ
jgi:hypothetical protein